jgi:hypothetical protein
LERGIIADPEIIEQEGIAAVRALLAAVGLRLVEVTIAGGIHQQADQRLSEHLRGALDHPA